MRKFVKMIAVFLIVISTAPVAFPFDSTMMEARFKIWEVEQGTYRLLYKDSEQQQIQIDIVDDKNKVLYTEIVSGVDGFIKPFDMKALPAGSYTFRLTTAHGVFSETIKIKTASEKYADLISINALEGSRQFALRVNQQVNTELVMYIYDEKDNLVHEEQVQSGIKLYDLQKVPSNLITVKIYQQDGLVKETRMKL